MNIERREFLRLAAASVVAAATGEVAAGEEGASATPQTKPAAGERVVDAGPLSGFSDERVYDQFRDQGFFVIRREKKVFALSSVCTHKGCKVRAHADQSFVCRCHNSTFDRDGRVLSGPATRNLPRLAVKQNSDGHVLVNVSRRI
jgi:cytochrome b6-f complex iron-sulfur subunit